MSWPTVVYNEEVMREGLGIEDVGIPLESKVELLDALSGTGLKRITLGAFVSPKFVPQMACFEDLLKRFHPKPGVTYLPYLHNEKARVRAEQYAPPLTIEEDLFTLFIDICDIHQRRNVNRSVEQMMASWPDAVEQARKRGIAEGRIGIGSAWGSNFMGKFGQAYRFSFLERQHALMEGAGIRVVEIGLHDSQSCRAAARDRGRLEGDQAPLAGGEALPPAHARCARHGVAVDLRRAAQSRRRRHGASRRHAGRHRRRPVQRQRPRLGHGADRGSACTCWKAWASRRASISTSSSSACGCWNGSSAGRRSATCRRRAHARPRQVRNTTPTCPAMESLEAAKHFKLGPGVYEKEGYFPWKAPIDGPFLSRFAGQVKQEELHALRNV